MIDTDSFEGFRDPETYDLVCDTFDEDCPEADQCNPIPVVWSP